MRRNSSSVDLAMTSKGTVDLLDLRARQYGADYLMTIAAWILRAKPRSLRKARADYRRTCVNLLRKIERAQEGLRG